MAAAATTTTTPVVNSTTTVAHFVLEVRSSRTWAHLRITITFKYSRYLLKGIAFAKYDVIICRIVLRIYSRTSL
jgi:chemotaxis methyl-accepting protein methylase